MKFVVVVLAIMTACIVVIDEIELHVLHAANESKK